MLTKLLVEQSLSNTSIMPFMPKPRTDAPTKQPCSETVGDRYRRCSFLNEIQHIDIYGKLHRSYMEKQKMYSKNDVALSVTSVSLSPTKICECNHWGSERNLDTEAKLSSFCVATRKSNLYPGQDNLSKRARKRWATCKKAPIDAGFETSHPVPRS